MKKYFLFILFCLIGNIKAQKDACYQKKTTHGLSVIDAGGAKCIAKSSTKRHTIFYTFAGWCAPCIYHLPSIKKLEQEYDAEVYVLLMDGESDNDRISKSINILAQNYPSAKILIIKDLDKGSRKKKYKDFLDSITPKGQEVITDMSKYIVLDNQGDTKIVTSYKLGFGTKDIKDDWFMVSKYIVPMLEKKIN